MSPRSNTLSFKVLSTILVFISLLALSQAASDSKDYNKSADNIAAGDGKVQQLGVPSRSDSIVISASDSSSAVLPTKNPEELRLITRSKKCTKKPGSPGHSQPFTSRPFARLWWTSVDDNPGGVTFLNLRGESSCYKSCSMDGEAWESYSWCQQYKTCWCRNVGISGYQPLRSPLWYPAVNIASTFRSTCAIMAQDPVYSQIPCEDVQITYDKTGMKLTTGEPMRPLGCN